MIAPTSKPPPPVEADEIKITVAAAYEEGPSAPPLRYVFVYRVRIENVGSEPAQLFWRHWRIHDPVGGDHEVEGEGVVGESPNLAPGEAHEYQSFCILQCPAGHMDGFYHFRRPDGAVFRAPVPRFVLRAPPGAARHWT